LSVQDKVNSLNAELNPICHLLALLGAHRILHVSRIRVKVIRRTQNEKDEADQLREIGFLLSMIQRFGKREPNF